MPYDLNALMSANVADSVEVKAGDSLLTIAQKGCLRLGNYRCPHEPSSTTHGIECMPEVWPVIFVSKSDVNALGNLLSAVRTGFNGHQQHIVKQLSLSAESLYRVLTCPSMAITEQLTAEKIWTIVEPSVLMSRSLVNYLQGKTPKNVTSSNTGSTTATISTPEAVSSPAQAEQLLSVAVVKGMINSALRSRNQGYHGDKRHHGAQQRSNSNGGGKRRF